MGLYKSFKNLGLGAKLNVGVALVSITLLAAILMVTGRGLRNLTIQTGRNRVEQEVEVFQRRFGEAEQELLAAAKLLKAAPELVEAVVNRDATAVRTAVAVGAAPLDFDDVDVVNTDGTRLAVVIEVGEPFDIEQEDTLLSLALLGIEATGVIVEEEEGGLELRLAAVVSLRDASGAIVGGLFVSREVDDEFLEKINFSRDDVHLVLIHEGEIVAQHAIHLTEWYMVEGDHVPTAGVPVAFGGDLLDETAIEQALSGQVVIAEDFHYSSEGVPHALAYVPLTVGDYTRAVISILVNLDELLIFGRQVTTNTAITFIFLALAAGVAVTVFGWRSIIAPIGKIRSAAERIESGDYGQRVEVTTKDEIGQLASAFNSMTAQLRQAMARMQQEIEERKRAEGELKRRNRELATLYEATTAIRSDLSLDVVLQVVAEQMIQALGSSGCVLSLWRRDRNLVETLVDYNRQHPDETDPPGTTYDLNNYPVTRRVLETGHPIVIQQGDPAADEAELALMENQNTKVLLMLPLIAHDRVVGLVELVDDSEARHYTPDQIRLAENLAAQAAIALENARLYEEVEERRTYLEGVLGAAPDAIVTLDADHQVVEWNSGAERLFGYLREEAIGHDLDDLITRPDILDEAIGFTQTVLGGDELSPVEVVRYRKDGSPVDVILASSPILVGDELIGTATVYTDITERKRAEERIKEQNEFLNIIIESLAHPFYVIDANDYTIKLANSAVRQGSLEESLTCYALTHRRSEPCRGVEHVCPLDEVKKTKKAVSVEHTHYNKDGDVRNVEIYGYPIFDGNGDVIQMIEYALDITERKRVEEALKESEERHRSLFDRVPVGLYRSTSEGRFLAVNPALVGMLGYPDMEALLAAGAADLYAASEDRERWQALVERDGVVRDFEVRLRRRDGAVVWMRESARAVRDADGRVLQYEGTLEDITERKQAEAERERLLVAEREQRLLAETLAEVTLGITSLTSHEAVLDEILRQVQRIVPYSTANIALWEGDALRVAHWRGYEAIGGAELVSSLVQTLDDLTVDVEVIQSRQPLVVPDTSQEPRWVALDETSWIKAYLAVPICLHDHLLGLLRLDGDTPGQFSAEDAKRLQPLANAAAIALENARLFGEVQRLAITDGLTGIYNRRYFFELAERELNRARRSEHLVSAIMLDVDHFKKVNDTYGHAIGDQVLRAVAERCSKNIRSIDNLGRYGGEEFAVILPLADLKVAQIVAERLRQCIADVPIPTEKGDVTVTISLGVASSVQDDEDAAALLNRADAAMYEAKQAGRNRVAVR